MIKILFYIQIDLEKAAVILVGVDTHDNDLGVVLGGGRGDNLLGAAVDDGLDGLLGKEDAGRIADAVSAEGASPGLVGVTSADGVLLVLVGHAVGCGQPSVDSVELDVVVLHHDTGDRA